MDSSKCCRQAALGLPGCGDHRHPRVSAPASHSKSGNLPEEDGRPGMRRGQEPVPSTHGTLLLSLLFGGRLASPLQPGALAGAAHPVLLPALVEAAAAAQAVPAVHQLALGVEEGEGRAAADAEVLGQPLVLGQARALLGPLLAHLPVFLSVRI